MLKCLENNHNFRDHQRISNGLQMSPHGGFWTVIHLLPPTNTHNPTSVFKILFQYFEMINACLGCEVTCHGRRDVAMTYPAKHQVSIWRKFFTVLTKAKGRASYRSCHQILVVWKFDSQFLTTNTSLRFKSKLIVNVTVYSLRFRTVNC